MTIDENTTWYLENQHDIMGWKEDYTIRKGYCVFTFRMNDGGQIVHHITIEDIIKSRTI